MNVPTVNLGMALGLPAVVDTVLNGRTEESAQCSSGYAAGGAKPDAD